MEQASQLIDQEWEEQVLTRLPAETEEQAFLLGAFVALPRNQKRGRSLTCIAGVCVVCVFFPTIR